MEEILASIRRIIADDSAPPTRTMPRAVPDSGNLSRPSAPLPPEPAPVENDVLELTQPVEQPGSAFTAVSGPDVMFRDEQREAPPPPPPPPVEAAPPAPPPAPVRAPAPAAPAPAMHAQDPLLSTNSQHAVSAAFNSLAATVLSDNSRTLEEIVKEMMRPMLKNWLDENLPGMVERIVRAEIERVARGGR